MAEIAAGTAAPTPVKPRGKKKRKLVKRIISIVIVLAILGGGGFGLYRFLNSGTGEVGSIYSQVAYLGSIQSKVSGSGVARAKESVAITLTQSGIVQELMVEAGQTVMAGQPMYSIFSQGAYDAVTAAREALEAANEGVITALEAVDAAYEGVETAKAGVPEAQEQVTAAEEAVDEAREQVTAAEAAVDEAREQVTAAEAAVLEAQKQVTAAMERKSKLEQELVELKRGVEALTVRAPYDGKLVQVESISLGQHLSKNASVAMLVNDRQMKLSLYFSYAYQSDIHVGQKAQVSIPAVMGSFEGKVEKINPVSYISPEGGVHFEVVIVFDNPGTLAADMLASAVLADVAGAPIYPYEDGKLQYYETRAIITKRSGPVEQIGTLMNYVNVKAGDVLLVLGTDDLDQELLAKQAEIDEALNGIKTAEQGVVQAKKNVEAAKKGVVQAQKNVEAAKKGVVQAQKNVEAAEKGVVQAEKNVEKAQKGITQAQRGVETANRNVEEAQKNLDKAQEELQGFSEALAPIDGTVVSCTLAEGKEVKSGDTVLIITNNTTMLVTIQVDDRNISFVKLGGTVELDWNGQIFMGTVTAVDMNGAQSGQGMTNYPVTLSVDNFGGQLMDGAWLRYSFVTSESADCILVPSSAVQYFSDKEGNRQSVVFVKRDVRPDNVPELELPTVEPGQKRRFPSEEEGYYPVIVETGLADTQSVEIISGVELGDEVFVNYTVTDSGSSWG